MIQWSTENINLFAEDILTQLDFSNLGDASCISYPQLGPSYPCFGPLILSPTCTNSYFVQDIIPLSIMYFVHLLASVFVGTWKVEIHALDSVILFSSLLLSFHISRKRRWCGSCIPHVWYTADRLHWEGGGNCHESSSCFNMLVFFFFFFDE